jgi:hypothetical protein
MANTLRRIATLLAAVAIAMPLAACEKEGPAERAGKEIDKAVDNVKDAVTK